MTDQPEPHQSSNPKSGPRWLAHGVLAVIAAVIMWSLQQIDMDLPNRTPPASASPNDVASSFVSDTSASSIARGNLVSLFSTNDYPADAIARNEQGRVRARLFVDSRGRVSDCVIAESSGSKRLDTATCRILGKRARFTPAHNAEGTPIASQFVTPAIVWRLAD